MRTVYYSDVKNCPTYAFGFGDFARIEIPQNAKALAAFVGAELAKGRPMTDVRNSVGYFLQTHEELMGNYYTPEEIAEHNGVFAYMDFPREVKAMFDMHTIESTAFILSDYSERISAGDDATERIAAACAREIFDSLATAENRRAEFRSSRFGVATKKPQFWKDISPEERALFQENVARWSALLRTDAEVLGPGCAAYRDEGVAAGVIDRLSRSLHYAYVMDRYSDQLDPDGRGLGDFPDGFVSFDDLSADMKADYEMVASVIFHSAVSMDLEIGHVETEAEAVEKSRRADFETLISTEDGCNMLACAALDMFDRCVYDDGNWQDVVEGFRETVEDNWVGDDLYVPAMTRVGRDEDGIFVDAVSVEDGEPVRLTASEDKAEILDLFSRCARDSNRELFRFDGVSEGEMLWDMDDQGIVKVFAAALDVMRREYMGMGEFTPRPYPQEDRLAALDRFSAAMDRLGNSEVLSDVMVVEQFKKRSSGLSV